MNKTLLTLAFLFALGSLSAQCGSLFFSEYIEGSSSNKATEIYNPTGSAVDLTDYVIYRYNNGSTIATDSLFPQGILAAGDVFVFGNPAANPAIMAQSDTLHSMTFYNGDDAISLMNKTTGDTLDIIGEIGIDPGSGWLVGTGSTNNFTLIRQFTYYQGETNWTIGATQWDVYPIDMVDSLGFHNAAAPSPNAGFTFSTTGLDATFTNSSTGAATYIWDFGDGFTDTVPNPVHSYTAPGTYTVCLLANSACGSDTICQAVTISCPAPTASFSASATDLTANFTNGSAGATSYVWDFGDGNTDTTANPTHVYSASGTYVVCLTATSVCGSDVFCDTITVTCALPTSAFTYTTLNFDATFTDASTGATSYLWDFGDGNTSTTPSPNHTYAAAGTYTVCQTVINACGADSTCQAVTITCPAPTAGFTASTTDLTANFTNGSTGATSYMWDFGDGNTDTTTNPTHVYSVTGTYVVCLTATNACGSDVFCDTITITCALPTAAFSNVETGLQVSFTDASTGTVSGYMWDFGDGNTSTTMNPLHTYSATGTYTVCLTVTNACGSDSTCAAVTVALTGVDDNELSNVNVYPNPVLNGITIDMGSNLEHANLDITDVNGRLIYSSEQRNAQIVNLDITNATSGIYFLRITSGNASTVVKLMKQ